MALLDEVKACLSRLAPRGWAKLFDRHNLDITVPKTKLADQLVKPLTVKRDHPGFEEFALNGIQAIEPGVPARSLLYHALASADVVPIKSGTLVDADFPTLAEIDAIENYIYSLAHRDLGSFQNPIVAVVAYQYRGKKVSAHRQHADLVFSRTGIARVGTTAARYSGAARAFDPVPPGQARGFAALPARYAAFIAEYRSPSADDAVLRATPGIDDSLPFLFPVHKLFAGKECLWDANNNPLTIPAMKFVEIHVNEKLARIHRKSDDNPGRIAPLSQFDITAPPFVRTSKDSSDLVDLTPIGASVLVEPVPKPLVRTARQAVGNATELVRFRVPKATDDNRFWTSLDLGATAAGRPAPEYANIRQEVVRTASGAFRLRDLNQVPNQGTPAKDRFDSKLAAGGYEAAHFVDGTCDGAISVVVPSAIELPVLPAFSLVTAVDYFPMVDQVEIEQWLEDMQGAPLGLSDANQVFPQGGPKPLSDGRFKVQANQLAPSRHKPNPEIPDPLDLSSGRPAFDPTERANFSATAIVSRAPGALTMDVRQPRRATSWLPDSASDVFMPGWDVSFHNRSYVSYGLGSPFPEDAKLCAALNSFWPAVAPDASRTYGFPPGERLLPTSIPLLDAELGYHANHPRVAAGEVTSERGWDGDFGPFVTEDAGGNRFINASDPMRADQTRAALDGTVGFAGLDRVDADELIRRMQDLNFCRRLLVQQSVAAASWLVGVEQVPNWSAWTSTVWRRAKNTLTGSGYVYLFAQVDDDNATGVGEPPLRRQFPVRRTVEIQLSATRAFWRANADAFKEVAR